MKEIEGRREAVDWDRYLTFSGREGKVKGRAMRGQEQEAYSLVGRRGGILDVTSTVIQTKHWVKANQYQCLSLSVQGGEAKRLPGIQSLVYRERKGGRGIYKGRKGEERSRDRDGRGQLFNQSFHGVWNGKRRERDEVVQEGKRRERKEMDWNRCLTFSLWEWKGRSEAGIDFDYFITSLNGKRESV